MGGLHRSSFTLEAWTPHNTEAVTMSTRFGVIYKRRGSYTSIQEDQTVSIPSCLRELKRICSKRSDLISYRNAAGLPLFRMKNKEEESQQMKVSFYVIGTPLLLMSWWKHPWQ
ncbi:hypothetical protein GE061_013829 [Apolygus lucorum]|uniref:Uncharacterized protein n=1 Tax=Apolygus lucorum TaxID=248454 RepID=A0A6A4K9F0_APOLU|nr:hypothetical protein GE061_013829 [Apolygus lucorum]